ncbi:L-1,2-propanediol oxidoreductase [Metakosakonia massiliensis]|uniref:L-1,2-propanediol oxidoreductase n=1 Tax=Phytobacter massiliensis TaxID=1485952 RepID=A0A6N3HX92_9ENTR
MVTINSTLISGAGCIPAIAPLLTGKKRLLLVSDSNIIRLAATQQIVTLLQAEGRQVQLIDNVPPEPSQHDVTRILGDAPDAAFDMVVGIGGGSVLDVAKLLSVLHHPRSPGLEALLAGEKPTDRIP